MSYIMYYILGMLSCFAFVVFTSTYTRKEEHVLHAFFWSVLWLLLLGIIVIGLTFDFFRRILPDWLSTLPYKIFVRIDDNITKLSKFILGEGK